MFSDKTEKRKGECCPHSLNLSKECIAHFRIIQGAFFNCSAQISVLKRKTLFNQRGSFVHREFHGTEFLIGCPSFFILVLKIGRNSKKKAPCIILGVLPQNRIPTKRFPPHHRGQKFVRRKLYFPHRQSQIHSYGPKSWFDRHWA